jgi:glycosyltransferase involved in cell wall biosynthesis
MISIITVCYNSEKTISRTFDSVLEQLYSPVEYIVIDGGSNDNTVEILNKYKERFFEKGIEFKWISEKDKGIYDAMNKGVALSQGEWMHFLNSDDYYINKFVLLNIVDILKNTANNILYGRLVKEKDGRQSLLYDIKENRLKLNMYFGCPIQQPATFYRSSILKKKYKFDISYKISADYKMFVEMIANNEKFQFIPQYITFFSEDGISSHRKNDLAIEENIRLLEECHYSTFFIKLSIYKKLYKVMNLFVEFLSRF